MDLTKFHKFFEHCLGNWTTERTYHYLTHQEVERSRTEFKINALTSALKLKVVADNQYIPPPQVETLPGFALAFHTVSEKGEEVSQQLNLLFVPKNENGLILEGDYLRDKAYEESRPIVSHFCFNGSTQELLMTTRYTRVVSVDSISLINPNLRIRRIYNYQRPPEGQPLENMILVGFGVEQKER
ncbi:phycobiliprotein lyase [Spirulina sp. 06S082]|uniref:phycobiliprotein lyase n=1 Tax=Spirulina sp. 06S082 TaxID=3110248 RepID=UPI002B20FD5C|nr:phycobiliprotein lyase [Spirulina sp. 06S082]MEA5471821.1 phycobiliprotein lyase [Spirulina sp. 06S082]